MTNGGLRINAVRSLQIGHYSTRIEQIKRIKRI